MVDEVRSCYFPTLKMHIIIRPKIRLGCRIFLIECLVACLLTHISAIGGASLVSLSILGLMLLWCSLFFWSPNIWSLL